MSHFSQDSGAPSGSRICQPQAASRLTNATPGRRTRIQARTRTAEMAHMVTLVNVISKIESNIYVCVFTWYPVFTSIRSCVECLAFGSGPFEKNCSKACGHLKVNVVEKMLKGDCRVKDKEGCWMTFTMTEQAGFDKYFVNVLQNRGIDPDLKICTGLVKKLKF